MADRTGEARPTPPQLRIRLIGEPDQVALAVHRLRQAFAAVEAGDPTVLTYQPNLARIDAEVVL